MKGTTYYNKHKFFSICILTYTLLVLINQSTPVYGQETKVQSELPVVTETLTPEHEITARRAELAKELALAKSALEAASANGITQVHENLNKEVTLLQQIDLIYTQQIAALDYESELKTTSAELEQQIESFRIQGSVEERPYPFTLLERMNDELHAQTGMDQSKEAAIQAAKDSLQESKAGYEEKERIRRQAKEALDTNKDDTATFELKTALRLAQLKSTASKAKIRLRELELDNQKLEKNIFEKRQSLLREKIDWVSKEVSFLRKDLTEILAELDEREFILNQTMERLKLELSLLDTRWTEARHRLEISDTKDKALIEEVEARQLARQVLNREVALLGKQLQYIAAARTIWSRRFETFNGIAQKNQLKEWDIEARLSLSQLHRESLLQEGRLTETRRELVTLQGRMASITATDTAQNIIFWLREQERNKAKLIQIYEGSNIFLESTRRLYEKFIAEIGSQIASVTWGERLAETWEAVKKVWRYELATIDDNPITVSKIVIALVILLLGFFISRHVSRLLGRQLLPRLHIPESATAAFQALTFYTLVLFFTFFALRIVNVPLTVFTVLGGAFAIGIGFGSQNIINNFISGLILFAERPIKVGDLVEIDNLYGTIEHIGARSTRVRSSQNSHIIVPNSSFLQNNVLNWTLSDNLIRICVKVGVIYGSPTREVERLLKKAVDEHEKVLKKPEPILLFKDFGNSSLDFEIHFWLKVKTMIDRWKIESDIRYRIDNLFREAGIVIAFPQRDVHLDSHKPLEIKVVKDRRVKDEPVTESDSTDA